MLIGQRQASPLLRTMPTLVAGALTFLAQIALAQTSVDKSESPSGPSRTFEYFPLKKGAYWLYEVIGSSGAAKGYRQVLVTDESVPSDDPNATDFVLSIIDHTIPAEDRPDEPTIIRRTSRGFECVSCGGLLLPNRIEQGSSWSGQTADLCRASVAPLSHRSSPAVDTTITVACTDIQAGISTTRVYAKGVGPTLIVLTGNNRSKPHVRIERLREYFNQEPAAPFPALPADRKP